MNSEIGTLPRPIDREQTKCNKADALEIQVYVAQQLATDLCAGIRADGQQHTIFLAPRYSGIDTVDAAARREDDLLYSPFFRHLENVLRAADIDMLEVFRARSARA